MWERNRFFCKVLHFLWCRTKNIDNEKTAIRSTEKSIKYQTQDSTLERYNISEEMQRRRKKIDELIETGYSLKTSMGR